MSKKTTSRSSEIGRQKCVRTSSVITRRGYVLRSFLPIALRSNGDPSGEPLARDHLELGGLSREGRSRFPIQETTGMFRWDRNSKRSSAKSPQQRPQDIYIVRKSLFFLVG